VWAILLLRLSLAPPPLLDHAVIKVYETLGKLTDTPEELQNKH